MSFLRGFTIAMVANAVLFVLSFLNNKLLYITLSEQDNGIYFLVMRLSLLFMLILGEWIRLTNINIAGKNRNLNPFLSTNSLVYSLFVCFLLLGGVFLARLFSPGVPLFFSLIVVVTGAFLLLRNVFQSLMLVNNRMMNFSVSIVSWGLLILALDFLFLVVYDLGLAFALYALVISSAVAAVWTVAASAASEGFSRRPSLKVFLMSGKLGVRAAFAVLGMFLMINIHAFAIEPLAGKDVDSLAMVAVFSVCFRVFQMFQRGSDVTGTVLYADVARTDERKGYRTTLRVCRNIFFFSVLFSIVFSMVGKTVILVIAKSSYLTAYVPTMLMLPGIIAVNTGAVMNSSYWGRGYPAKIILAPFVAALAGFGLDIILIPSMGISGATLSFTVMTVVWFGYVLIVFRKDSGYRYREILVPQFEDFREVYSQLKNRLRNRKTTVTF